MVPDWIIREFVIFALGVGTGGFLSQVVLALEAGRRRRAVEQGVLMAVMFVALLCVLARPLLLQQLG